MSLLALVLAAALAAVHVFAARVRLSMVPRSVWLSVAGGVSVSYVFVHLLPELHADNGAVAERFGAAVGFVEHHLYLVALLGFVGFHVLEQRAKNRDEGSWLFGLHVAAFGVYNALVGYLLVHHDLPGPASRILYATALGLHLLVNDHALAHHYPSSYHRAGRWVLAAAVLAGAAVGTLGAVDAAFVNLGFAVVAGATVLNAIKEELPEARSSRSWAFVLGAAGYAALLVAI
ncbi:hypothetical protein BRC94_11485 [Halobacteriales archaeon QS_5_70_17]|nr:MAG: hypothetical protein BRC94_11485 [Halobacteriales archaeon QS_5_70_17]